MPRRGENIYLRKDGRWEGRYRCGTNPVGKPKYRSVYGKSYRAVKDRLTRLKVAPSKHYPLCKSTVASLFSEWLTAIEPTVKASTHANYRMKVNKHLLPEFGDLPYQSLNRELAERFVRRKIDSGLSEKYVADLVTVLKTMTRYMSRLHGYPDMLEQLNVPKYQRNPKRLLRESEQNALCNYLCSNMNETSLCILLSYYTGLRVGEICGLQWNDIDMENRLISVRRTVQRIQDNSGGAATHLQIDLPKSFSSRRTIPLPEILLPYLRAFRGQAEHFVLSGSGHIIEPRTMQHRFQSILIKADLPSVSYHSLRHMFATNCLQAGADIKSLSEILGHKAVETTLNLYVHSSMERKRICMEMLVKKVHSPSEMWSAAG